MTFNPCPDCASDAWTTISLCRVEEDAHRLYISKQAVRGPLRTCSLQVLRRAAAWRNPKAES